jgi:Flp pilus assembly pilin Flp
MRSSIARATAIEYGLIAAGISAQCIIRYLHNGSEATAIEYGLIAAGIAVAIIVVVQALSSRLYGSL